MEDIMKFINENSGWINFWIGILGLILSIISICVGVKAYKVAKEIYEKGVNFDKDKMLTQTRMEFILGFINPFTDFQKKTQLIYEETFYDETVFRVNKLLKKCIFSVEFPYFDVHKGDIFISLEKCEDGQLKAFKKILVFIDKAKCFKKGMDAFVDELNNCLREHEGNPDFDKITIKQFFNEKPYVREDIFKRGVKMQEKMDDCIQNLPKELKIEEGIKEFQ